MKKLITLALLVVSLTAFGQQDPYFTHFKDVISAYNPAYTGHKKGEICLSGLTHHQWRDYDDITLVRGTDGSVGAEIENVAPTTYNLNVGTIFGLGKSENNELGVGLSVIRDEVGFTQMTSLMGNLNYRRNLEGGFKTISAGIGIGGQQFGFVNPQFRFRDQNDPNIPAAGGAEMKLNLNFGLFYQQKRLGGFQDFYAGLSSTHLNGADYQIIVGNNGRIDRKYVPHYYGVIGADYDMGNMVLEPAILIKYPFIASEYRPQFDLNVTALFASSIRGGVAYRQYGNADAASLLIGYIPSKDLEIGYSYDITVSSIQSVSNGTHEIMVKYCIPIGTANPPTKIKILTPRHL